MTAIKIERDLKPTMLDAIYWLGEGYTVKEIAYELDITPSGAQNRLQRARYVLGVHNNQELLELTRMLGVMPV